jgi:putative RNase toxin 44 of polymorphic toxin system
MASTIPWVPSRQLYLDRSSNGPDHPPEGVHDVEDCPHLTTRLAALMVLMIAALAAAAGPANARPVDCDGPCPGQTAPPPPVAPPGDPRGDRVGCDDCSPPAAPKQKVVTVYRSSYAYSTPYLNARTRHPVKPGRYVATCEANSGSRGRYSNPWWSRMREGTWVNNGDLRGAAKMGIGDCAAPPNDTAEQSRGGRQGCDDCTATAPQDEQFYTTLNYIHDEIQRNTRSKVFRDIHALNRIGVVTAAAAAAAGLEWASLVCAGCVWDHKKHLGRLGSVVMDDEFFTNVPGTPWRVFYDIWSNIHYGYVGRAAGFSAKELIVAQNLNSKKTGERLPLLQKRADELKIKIGFGLYRRYPSQRGGAAPAALTPPRIQKAIVAALPRLQTFGPVSVRAHDLVSAGLTA